MTPSQFAIAGEAPAASKVLAIRSLETRLLPGCCLLLLLRQCVSACVIVCGVESCRRRRTDGGSALMVLSKEASSLCDALCRCFGSDGGKGGERFAWGRRSFSHARSGWRLSRKRFRSPLFPAARCYATHTPHATHLHQRRLGAHRLPQLPHGLRLHLLARAIGRQTRAKRHKRRRSIHDRLLYVHGCAAACRDVQVQFSHFANERSRMTRGSTVIR